MPSPDPQSSPPLQGPRDQQYDKQKEKDVRASIGRITNSLKCLPVDEQCTPGLLTVKKLLIEQVAQEQEALRAMKPLATRIGAV